MIFKPNSAFNRDSYQSLQRVSQVRVHGSDVSLRPLNFSLSLLSLADDLLGLITAHAELSLLFQLDQFSLLLLQVQRDLLINDRLRLAQIAVPHALLTARQQKSPRFSGGHGGSAFGPDHLA